VTKLGGFDVYTASPPSPIQPKEGKAIVLFSDVFGFSIDNPKVSIVSTLTLPRQAAVQNMFIAFHFVYQLISDELARRLGVVVYCPDYFDGEPSLPRSLLPLKC
jgi:hypothetical protein